MEASKDGYIDTVRVLLEAKADPNITDEVKLHYSHCLYNSNLMYYVIEWSDCSTLGCPKRSCRSSQDVGALQCSSGHQKQGIAISIVQTDNTRWERETNV